MTEMVKTSIYCVVALIAVLMAIATRPAPVGVSPDEQIGKPLFPDFTDALEARSLEIVRYDEELSDLQRFKVAQVDGRWVIPSHQNYPADAENRIRDAATGFVDLNVIGVASDEAGEHEVFGVVEPDQEKVKLGEKGVGTLVTMQDAQGKDLVQLVIGKKVRDTEGQRFVRVPSQSRVYTVKIDPEQLPARFDEWIQKDLLDLNSWDVEQVVLNDYSVQTGATRDGRLAVTDYDQRLKITLHEDSGTWKLDELLESRGGKLEPTELLEGEELNEERLDNLKDALDDLEIVDVQSKPKGLGADLKADKGFLNDVEGTQSLIQRGFYPVPMPDGKIELLSSDGEVLVRSKEGVEYVLRFGQVAGVEEEGEESSLNRFLFVTARLWDEHFPTPELEKLPEAAGDASPADPTDDQDQADDTDQAADKDQANDKDQADDQGQSGEQGQPEKGPEDADQPSEEGPAAPEGETEPAGDPGEANETEDSAAETGDAEASESEQPDADSSESSEAADTQDDQPVAESSEPDTEENNGDPAAEGADQATEDGDQKKAATDDREKPDVQAEIERITKENQRKLDEHKEKVKKAQDKVNELSYRFADWYYVISEDVYKKLHLGRADIIKESEEAKKEGFGVDAFRELEDKGLDQDATDDSEDGEASN